MLTSQMSGIGWDTERGRVHASYKSSNRVGYRER